MSSLIRNQPFGFAGFRRGLCTAALVLCPILAGAQITITNGVQTYPALTNTVVTMSNLCELHITEAVSPIPGCTIHLNSTDSYFILEHIKPSTFVASYLSQVRINGGPAIADSNCRVVQYGVGTVVIPQSASFQPLTVYSGPHLTGSSSVLGQYVYYKGTGLGVMNASISSFKLKRGYLATFAQNENGTGISKCYVAQDGDMEVSVLPADFDDSIRFVYVVPWRWSTKKGIAGNIENGLDVQWKYNWNIDQNSTRDLEYVPIRQERWWPGLGQNWQSRGACQLLGYNEPDRPDQANLSVGDALSSWPDLLGTGLRVGAPAVSDGGRNWWLYPFVSQANAANLRLDFVPVHYYWCYNPSDPNGAANQMYDFLKATYDQVKRPLWVTEWNNGASWTGCGDPSYSQQQAAIAAMIDMLDTTPFVERYAPYNWVEDVRRLKWDSGTLTAAGVAYRDNVSPIAYVQALQDNGTRSFAQLDLDGDVLDGSGYANNGITSGSPAYTNGHSGQALVFDGAHTVVTLPPNVARNNAFSFAGWVYWNGGADWQRIFDFGNSTTEYAYLTPKSSSGTMRFKIRNGGSEHTLNGPVMTPNQWHHVAVTLGAGTARILLDGAIVASDTGWTVSPANFDPRRNSLGKSQFYSDPLFKGLMDDVLITDYAMSSSQIAGLQTNTPPHFTSNLFDRGSGTEGIPYNNTMAGTAMDPDAGDTLSYSKAIGPAWLIVADDGSLSGTPTSGDGGTNYCTVRATDAAGQNAFTLVTISVTTVTAAGTWISDASGAWNDPNRWLDGDVATGAGQPADFSTINITGNRLVVMGTSRSIGTLRFGDTSGSQAWTVSSVAGSTLTLDSASATSPAMAVTNTATISVPVAGTNGFTKSGPGTLILTGDNSLSGTVNIDTSSTTSSDGAVRAAHPNALANATLMRIRNNSGASSASTLQLDGASGGIRIGCPLEVSCRNNSIATLQNISGTNQVNEDVLLNVGGNRFNIQSDAGLLVFNGTNRYIGSFTAGRIYAFSGVGSYFLNGPLLNSVNGAPISVTKSGSGTLTLAATNTYGSTTTISEGALIVNGLLPAGGLTLASGVSLGGHGAINSAVTLPANSTLEPGASIGRLTVNNSVTLQADSTTRMEINKAGNTNDQIYVTGSLVYGGTLEVTNLDGTLWAGDSFQLFSATSPTGAFAATNLPPLPAGLYWQWTPATGTLSIDATVALNSTNLTANLVSNALHLSWPSDHTGWRVETNSVAITESNSWFTLDGSTMTNLVVLPINPASGQVYFRLVYP